MLSLGIGLTSVPVLARRGGYDPDALAFFARLTTPPTAARKKLYNDLIVALKTAGVWGKLDALYILAAADAQAARQNLVANAYNLTASGSPTFTVDRGYTGDGVGAYLDTGANRLTLAAYKQDDATLFAWEFADIGDVTSGAIGAIGSGTNRVHLRPRQSGLFRAAVNAALAPGATVPTNKGLTAADRSGSGSQSLFKNGVFLTTEASVSATMSSSPIEAMRSDGTLYRASPLALFGFGASLGTGGHAAIQPIFNSYLTAVGAA